MPERLVIKSLRKYISPVLFSVYTRAQSHRLTCEMSVQARCPRRRARADAAVPTPDRRDLRSCGDCRSPAGSQILPLRRVWERKTSPLSIDQFEESFVEQVDTDSSPLADPSRVTARKQTTLNGTGASSSKSGDVVDPPANRRASRMCSASRARKPVGAEVPQHHPQLQRAEPAPELDAGVHQVPHAGRLRSSSGTRARARTRAAARPCAGSRAR